MKTHNLKKGDRIIYRSSLGYLYSAYVKQAHKDDTLTVRIHFPLDDRGLEAIGCFQGDTFRIGRANIVAGFGN